MRGLLFFSEMAMLLPIACVRPFAGVLLWSWISFMNPHQMMWGGLAGTLPWAALAFATTIIGCVVAREPKRFPVNPVTVMIALFLVCTTVTTVAAQAPMDQVIQKWELVSKAFFFLL